MARLRDLDRHIGRLCRHMGISRSFGPRGRAQLKARTIVHPPISDPFCYLIALHELGHHVVGHLPRRLDREAAAWYWAFSNSMIEIGIRERQLVSATLLRYLWRAKLHGWDPPGDLFLELLRWWGYQFGSSRIKPPEK